MHDEEESLDEARKREDTIKDVDALAAIQRAQYEYVGGIIAGEDGKRRELDRGSIRRSR